MSTFVPESFRAPSGLDHARFRLRPLGPEHNESDYAAWTSNMDHIRRTPGFESGSWPHPMAIEDNFEDLVRHAADFAARRGFTYTVLSPDDIVIGCVYIYPSEDPRHEASVRSWVRAADSPLDPVLYRAVCAWLAEAWPFTSVDYPPRLEA